MKHNRIPPVPALRHNCLSFFISTLSLFTTMSVYIVARSNGSSSTSAVGSLHSLPLLAHIPPEVPSAKKYHLVTDDSPSTSVLGHTSQKYPLPATTQARQQNDKEEPAIPPYFHNQEADAPRPCGRDHLQARKGNISSNMYQEPEMWQALHWDLGYNDVRTSQANGKDSFEGAKAHVQCTETHKRAFNVISRFRTSSSGRRPKLRPPRMGRN